MFGAADRRIVLRESLIAALPRPAVSTLRDLALLVRRGLVEAGKQDQTLCIHPLMADCARQLLDPQEGREIHVRLAKWCLGLAICPARSPQVSRGNTPPPVAVSLHHCSKLVAHRLTSTLIHVCFVSLYNWGLNVIAFLTSFGRVVQGDESQHNRVLPGSNSRGHRDQSWPQTHVWVACMFDQAMVAY